MRRRSLQGYPMTNRKVRATAVNIVAALMLLFETSAFAKTTPITLPELVKRSSVIVYGHMGKVGGSPLRPSASWVPFKASQIIKGDLSLTREDILLCDSRPPMMEYPDLSRLRGDLVLFLRRKGVVAMNLPILLNRSSKCMKTRQQRS